MAIDLSSYSLFSYSTPHLTCPLIPPLNVERKPRTIKKGKLRETPFEYTERLRRKLLRWARDNAEAVGDAPVPVFETDKDRAEDNWEVLFKIAAVIDPDNVQAVVEIALAKESSPIAERESEQMWCLKGCARCLCGGLR